MAIGRRSPPALGARGPLPLFHCYLTINGFGSAAVLAIQKGRPRQRSGRHGGSVLWEFYTAQARPRQQREQLVGSARTFIAIRHQGWLSEGLGRTSPKGYCAALWPGTVILAVCWSTCCRNDRDSCGGRIVHRGFLSSIPARRRILECAHCTRGGTAAASELTAGVDAGPRRIHRSLPASYLEWMARKASNSGGARVARWGLRCSVCAHSRRHDVARTLVRHSAGPPRSQGGRASALASCTGFIQTALPN